MVVMDYRTQDGLADYGFSVEFQSDRGWRVYIVFQLFPPEHDDSLRLPYQSIDGNGRRYVDWPEKLDSLGDAKVVAALWAELTQQYLRSQEQHAFYVELIKRHPRTQERGTAAIPHPARPGDAVGTGGAGVKH